MIARASLILPLALLAGCSVVPSAPPAAPPRPLAPPRLIPAAPPIPRPPMPKDWADADATPGTWVYRRDARGSIALFGPAGGDALMTLRCDSAARRIYLSLRFAGPAAPTTITIRTTQGDTTMAARPTGGPYAALDLDPGAPLLDQIAFSRGHVALDMPGQARVIAPVWAEPQRVIEDCRSR